MSVLTSVEISPASIAAEKAKLTATHQRLESLTAQLTQLQEEVKKVRDEERNLSASVRWRELMAAVNEDDAVYGITERLTDAFTAFHESLVEPEGYMQNQRDEAQSGENIVQYSDTDDYADFSGVEAVVEDVLAVAKESLETHSADPTIRSSNRSSPAGSLTHRAKSNRASAESEEDFVWNAAARRQALLQLLVVSVLMGKVEQHCRFDSIRDPSDAPRTDAEELRDGVAAVWQWLFYEQPTMLTAAERKEWMDIAGTFLGEAYTATP
ncbi:hypothetical protein ABB37_04752 [Leptomonas pyrrhocoris]|uniref:Uncharacterized protein n=1 Tax=Leptomonas pyrrhocoris TaxID=157538 RepID=A0A0M9G202_LEPPY|nr:hypothetical protein ABB37_04752 [Leptomonas pyrrhocoris]XP_015658985.1 hypothetical protein ABB37_04752 [Leptomonas pyrrhocoris]KPA80545.1 hypothetical protein ABB37_04752 [Leptomonas pyrrhocoris]KPA80546.1 hypothetical protein ABB37_04752 [Leptomonas pyrrhocoris]|eukprot:XP_015658984.1 hypothetical protein ABB37_04752 [Leptomonas pyrrhocoris]